MDWYLVRVASQTTTDLPPESIHQIGLKEVARIQGEYARIGPKMGYNGPAAGLPTWVSEQAKYKPFKTEQEVIDVYRKLDAATEDQAARAVLAASEDAARPAPANRNCRARRHPTTTRRRPRTARVRACSGPS